MRSVDRLRGVRSRVAEVTRVRGLRRLRLRLDLVADAIPENDRLAETLELEIASLEATVADVAERRLAAKKAASQG